MTILYMNIIHMTILYIIHEKNEIIYIMILYIIHDHIIY